MTTHYSESLNSISQTAEDIEEGDPWSYLDAQFHLNGPGQATIKIESIIIGNRRIPIHLADLDLGNQWESLSALSS